MSGRCKACNRKLSEYEMKRKLIGNASHSRTFSDLCSACTIPPTNDYPTEKGTIEVPILEDDES